MPENFCYVCARQCIKDTVKQLDHIGGNGKPFQNVKHATFCSEPCLITFLNRAKEEGHIIKLHWKEIKKSE